MKLYISVWTIKDPLEMLTAIDKLHKSGIDFTLLSQEIIGVRPRDLFKALKVIDTDITEIANYVLYKEDGKPLHRISIKSINLDSTYWAVFYIRGVGNITIATKDSENEDPELLVSPFDGLSNSPKEKILYEYAEYLGFEIP